MDRPHQAPSIYLLGARAWLITTLRPHTPFTLSNLKSGFIQVASPDHIWKRYSSCNSVNLKNCVMFFERWALNIVHENEANISWLHPLVEGAEWISKLFEMWVTPSKYTGFQSLSVLLLCLQVLHGERGIKGTRRSNQESQLLRNTTLVTESTEQRNSITILLVLL